MNILVDIVGVGLATSVIAVALFYLIARKLGLLGGLLDAYPLSPSSRLMVLEGAPKVALAFSRVIDLTQVGPLYRASSVAACATVFITATQLSEPQVEPFAAKPDVVGIAGPSTIVNLGNVDVYRA